MDVLQQIMQEVNSAQSKHPQWNNNLFVQLAVIGEEFGEAQQAALQACFEPNKGKNYNDVRLELIQTAAMCVRTLQAYHRWYADVEVIGRK